MFVSSPSRERPGWRWATPALFILLLAAFVALALAGAQAHTALLRDWGALSGALVDVHAWNAAVAQDAPLRLVTALFLHADWSHLLGNLVFLLIFGLPAEKAMGPWRFLGLFVLGGALANLAAVASIGNADSADNVAVYVPGATADLGGMGGFIDEMAALTSEKSAADPRR